MAEHPSEHELRRRNADLAQRIAASRAQLDGDRGAANPTRGARGMAEGFKLASEFLAGILVGIAIGYGIDSLFGTGPFGLIAFLMFGFAAGVLNVVRSTAATGAKPDGPAAPDR